MTEQDKTLAPDLIAFGPFVLDLVNRTLSKSGAPVRVRGRELSILMYLAQRAGTFVTRDELIASIWSGSKVTDANVRVQMGALKRLLGDGRNLQEYVTFTPGQGYRFQGETQRAGTPPGLEVAERTHRRPSPVATSRSHNLPIRIKPIYGRDEDLQRLTVHMPRHRLVTLVGPGGIGKTTLAMAGAEVLVDAYEDSIWLVNLAGLSDARLVSATIAVALNISLLSPDPVDDLVKYLWDKQILIVLDNCEHLIEEVATLVEKVLTRTRDVHFMATSREPLRVDGEWLCRLTSLDVPPRVDPLAARDAMSYPAVRLFIERVRLSDDQFILTDADARAVAELCRRLDGNPLAVELAAARVGLFGVQGLADQLVESFSMLTQGRRTALPRHQTLRATLDWSYDILPDRERLLLARLSVFRGEFTLASALAIAGMASQDVVDGLAELTAKSLVQVDAIRQPALYRMLFLTRDYAVEKLTARGEFDIVAKRHAETYLDLLHCSGSEVGVGIADTWIDDIRSALNWTLSETGDFDVGMALITASFGTALRIASLHERGLLLDRAGERIRELGKQDPAFELRLLVERVSILNFGENKPAEMEDVAERAMTLADNIRDERGDVMPLVEMLITKISIYFGEGNVAEMRRHIRSARALQLPPDKRAATLVILERMEFQAEHFGGNHAFAKSLIEKILAYPPEILRTRHFAIADYISPGVTCRIFLSRIQWLQGYPETASRTAEDALDFSKSLNALVICYVLAFSAIPIAIWRGDRALARHYIKRLETTATASSLAYWQNWSPFYEAILDMDDAADLTAATARIEAVSVNAMQIDHVPMCVPWLSDNALSRLHDGFAGWNWPEIYRLQGANRLDADDHNGAETFFLKALDLANARAARALALRAATSLAALWGSTGRRDEARQLLSELLEGFTEGLHDADHRAAALLLKSLGAL